VRLKSLFPLIPLLIVIGILSRGESPSSPNPFSPGRRGVSKPSPWREGLGEGKVLSLGRTFNN